MPKPNLDQARQFLELLDPDAEQFTFQTFDDSPAKSEALAKVYHGSLDELSAPLATLQAAGAGVFITVNETDLQGRKNTNIVRVRACFVDLDGAPLQPVLACRLEPHVIVESSPERWHVYWIVADLALNQFTPVQKAIIARFGGDKAVHDLPRVMRLPGYIHQKGAAFLTHIHGVSDRMPYSAEQILAAFPPPAPKTATKPSSRPNGPVPGSRPPDNRFRLINDAALANLDAWVPELFPCARPASGGYRIHSADLGRDLEEDLSITSQGIKDFGVHDLGDPNEGKRTAIDLVIEYAGASDVSSAASWLAQRLGLEADDPLYTLSHDALALDMADQWQPFAQHCAAWSRWLFFLNARWAPDDVLHAMSGSRAYLRDRADTLVQSAHQGTHNRDHDDARAGQENGKVAAVRTNGGGRPEPGPQ
jgi:hypothetical protein